MSRQNCREIKNFMTVCRICLVQYPEVKHKDLGLPINDQDGGEGSLLIFEVLENVMGEEIVNFDGYPSSICDTCLGVLGMAYDLKRQYINSNKILEKVLASQQYDVQDTLYENKRFPSKITNTFNVQSPKKINQLANVVQVKKEQTVKTKRFYVIKQKPIIELISRGVQTTPEIIEIQEDSPNVEILLDPKAYDIKDLVIVEDPPKLEKDDNNSYEFYLRSIVGAANININTTERRPNNCSETKITPLSEDIDVDSLDPFEASTSTSSKIFYACHHCTQTFDSEDCVKEHVPICENFKKLQHRVKYPAPEKKRLNKTGRKKRPAKCNTCDKVLPSRPALWYHMLHHKGKQFTCDECGKSFLTLNILKGHQINAHQNKTVEVCPVCAKTFTYRNGLHSHMKLHSDELRYQCSLCDKKFRFIASKTSHELSHTGAKPYGCRFCEIHFPRHSCRQKHERSVHTGERPYKCQYCITAYLTKEHLKRHMISHSGSFKCSVCNKGLVDAEVLKLHLRMKHNIRDENQEEILTNEMEPESETNEFDEHNISDRNQEEIFTEEIKLEIEQINDQYHIMPGIMYDE